MSPKTVIVTGANCGIGLGLVQQLAKNPDIKIIIATVRDFKNAKDLQAIGDSRIHILLLEVTSEESVDRFVKEVEGIVGEWVESADKQCRNWCEPPNRSLLTQQIDINTISVVLLTQKLLPLLIKASSQTSGPQLSTSRSAVIFISSGAGSIIDNTTGSGWFDGMAYRLSKAALNQFARTIAVDLKDDKVLSVSFCPGWVKTRLAGDGALLTVEETTGRLVESFGKLNEEHNGLFFENDLTLKNF